jgi:hypothetical protein
MADNGGTYTVGFGKPPKHSRFLKGQSGNPNGRPKGSLNPATILEQACRERILVTKNGRTHHASKFQASMWQLMNKAASGDLNAIKQLLGWLMSTSQFAQTEVPMSVPRESDALVMATIVDRIRHSEVLSSETEPALTQPDPITPEEPS